MTEVEKANFILAVISNENLQISAAVATPMAECQQWMKEIIEPEESKRALKAAPGGIAKSD